MNTLGGASSNVNILNTLGGGGFTGILSDDLDCDGYSVLNASGYNFEGNSGAGLATDSLGNLLFNGHVIDANVDNDAELWSTFRAIQNVSLSGFQLKNVAAGSDPSDAVTVSQLGTQLGSYLPLTGGTMTGGIYMSSANISGIDTTTTRVLNTDVLNGKSANIIATNSVLDMGGQSIQNANTVTSTNLQGNVYTNSITSVNETDAVTFNVGIQLGDGGNLDLGENYRIINMPNPNGPLDGCNLQTAQSLVNQTNHTISGIFRFAQPIYVNGILAQNSDITGVDNVTATSFNVDSIQANAGGGVVFNSPVVLTNPQNGTLQSIQGANSITCKTLAADTQLSVGNIIMGTGGFNMYQQVISNLPDTTASQPTNAVNFQTMAGYHTTTNLTADGPLLMGTQPVISHNSPSVSGHLMNLHYFENNSIHSNTYYINDNQTDIQTVYNDHSNEQGVTYKIASGSYGGSTLTISGSHNIHFECSHPGNGSTITELAGGRGVSIQNSARVRFQGLQIEGDLTINGRWSSGGTTVDTNCVFSCCEILGATNLGNLSAVTGFITFYRCTFAGPIVYYTGTTTCYFLDCDFNNQNITNSGANTRIIISNGTRMSNTQQNNYIGYGMLTTPLGIATHVTNAITTPANATSISSAPIEVSSDPATNNTLTRKSYVDTKVASVTAGTAISITGTATAPVINNTGVTSIIAGSGIAVSSSTGAVTISATGGGGGSHENIAYLNSTNSLTENGALAMPLSDAAYTYQIEDSHFGDARVSLTSNGEIAIVGGNPAGSRTFSIQLQFRLDTNAASSSAGPITFFLVDYFSQERYFCGEFDPQSFATAKQIFFFNETFTLTVPDIISGDSRLFKMYIKDDVTKWQNGGNITQWTVSNVKCSIKYIGQVGFQANVPTSFTPPIASAPSITSISATGASSIELHWSHVTGAENYYIYRSTNNTTFTLIYVISSIYNTYTDTGLNASTTYYYKVGAQNDEGVGPLSTSASATTDVSLAPNFSDYWTDSRAPYTNFGGSYIHPSSDAIILSAVMTKLGSGPTSIYMIRRQDGGSWAEGTQHSPVTIKNGFPDAGKPLQGEFTTRGQMLSMGGGGCTWDSDIAGVTWNIGQTKSPYNLPYNASTNPYGYSSWP